MLKKVWFKNSENIYSVETSSAKRYVEARTLEALVGCTNPNIYEDYLDYCRVMNFKPMYRCRFFRFLKSEYNCYNIIRKIDGKSYRILVV